MMSQAGANNSSGGGGTSLLQNAIVTLTSAQIKNLVASPLVVIPNQGPGTVIIPYFTSGKLYVPTGDAFVNPSFAEVDLAFFNGASSVLIGAPIFLDAFMTSSATTDQVGIVTGAGGLNYDPTLLENVPLYIGNFENSVDYTGNDTGDNTLVVQIQYVVLQF